MPLHLGILRIIKKGMVNEMKKKKWKIWVIALLLFGSCFLLGNAKKSVALSEEDIIKSAIEKKIKSNVNVNAVYYLDYDKNGRKEAFILTGKKGNSDEANTLWFGYCTNNKVHVKKIKKDVMLTAHTLKLKSAVLFCAGRYCETSTPETVYCVKGNKVKSIFDGDTISKLKGNSFTSIQSAYDSGRDSGGAWMGHTWKPYYFYYKNGKVYEYKAKQISKDNFKRNYSNAAKILKKYKKKGHVLSIYVRSNGRVHVNYQKDDGEMYHFTNVTFTISGKKLVQPIEGTGIYKGSYYE